MSKDSKPKSDGNDEFSDKTDSPHDDQPLITLKLTNIILRVFKSIWFVCIFSFLANLAVLILQATVRRGYATIQYFSVVSLILSLVVLFTDCFERSKKGKVWISHPKRFYLWFSFKYVTIICIMAMTIGCVLFLISGTINNPLNLSPEDNEDAALKIAEKVLLIIFPAISVISNLLLIGYVWQVPKKAKSQLLMFLSCFASFILGTIEIRLCHDWDVRDAHEMKITPVLYTYTAAFIICGSIMGMSISYVINEKNRLSDILGNVTLLLDCFFIIVAILCIISGSNSLVLHGREKYEIPLGVPALFFCCLILCVISIFCSRLIRKRTPPSLEVEEMDLSSLTEAQKMAYAKLITFNRKSNPGVSGEAVISLMEAYSQTTLDGMKCRVLRVFHKPAEEGVQKEPAEPSKTWETLDQGKTVFDEEETLFEYDEIDKPPKPLSKNQKKKLAKKAAAKDGSSFPLDLQTEQDIKDRVKFHADLMATEALVLLTSIEEYDLTGTLTGRFGKLIQRAFGKNSYTKLLCIRFGLLAFHWPFVRSTFYCSNSKKPVARSAAVMYAIGRWNKKQDRDKKCTILLDPTYKNASPEKAIRFGGWYKIKLPASHIIDLRPHKNNNITQYFKSIKYRNQDGEFRRSNGVTIEEKDFKPESCDTIMNLWHKIASERTDKGNTSVLINPNAEFIRTIGKIANKDSNRSLLFLKVDGEVIASCVLFRIGDTITSDLQGLHHEKARPYKAYFVMMQEVISIALKEGKSFVDFGPTTEKPKLDIGCQNVPLTGALHTSSPILSMIVSFAADKVDV